MLSIFRPVTIGLVLALGAAQAVAASSSPSAGGRAQNATGRPDEPKYTNGPVTEVDYIHVEYGGFEKYVDWLDSTWKPTMEALEKAGIIIDYKVFQLSPKSPDQPNVFLMLTFKDMAAYAGDIGDKRDEFEAVTDKVICSTECQNSARVARNEIRKVLGTELLREVLLK